jgi:ribosome-associated protein
MNSQQITEIAVNALENVKGENIVVLDTSKISSLFSAMIVCSGSSSRQIGALIDRVEEDLKKNGVHIIGVEGKQGGEWVLLDSGDVIIHVMLPHVRSYYAIENLWNEELRASE